MPLTSFYSALTGLNNNAQTINVIGNNLANINSTAFKGGRTSFAEIIGGASDVSANGNSSQVGLGSITTGITSIFTQGSIQYTGRGTDMAISGNGFYLVSTGEGGQGYTRAGNFAFTRSGQLISADGYLVLGYTAQNGVINTNSSPAPITILKGSTLPPKATSEVDIVANLDSRTATNGTYSTTVQVFDSLGKAQNITFVFTKGATGWTWSASGPNAAGTGNTTYITGQTLTFTNGVATGSISVPNIPDSGGTTMSITFNPNLTSYAANSNVSSTSQNGYASSLLRDISVDAEGIINGVFENGQVLPMAQLALANFPNVEGLLKFKGSTFVAQLASGDPSVGTAGTGGRGSIAGASLEQSNVDIAQEFTNLIIAQRGYQANSRVISTSDELYQESLNLKR
jgi:flagellar hook protein FlgE